MIGYEEAKSIYKKVEVLYSLFHVKSFFSNLANDEYFTFKVDF